MHAEVVCDAAPFAEGPVWCEDGTLVVSHVAPGLLRRIWPATGRSEIIAHTGGGANSAQRAADGGFVVAQNGGIDFTPFAPLLGLAADAIPPFAPAAPGLQRVLPSGDVIYLTAGGLLAPNDLVVAADGTIYFTDPGPHVLSSERCGRVMAFTPHGALRVIARDFQYDNGIALSPAGRLLVVEGAGLMWVDGNGEKEWLVEPLPGIGDGLCFDIDGRVYVATPLDHCIRILAADGTELETLDLRPDAIPTNCCFGGSDFRTLFTTELKPGRVRAFEGMPAPGLPLVPWAVV